MSQLYHEFGVTLERKGPDTHWGIRLAGGSDLNSPLIIIRVNLLFLRSQRLTRVGNDIRKCSFYVQNVGTTSSKSHDINKTI